MAIKISQDIDLGHDKNRIKDKRDKDRQEMTAKAILNRYFNDDPEKRYELQILADEVGMGKTYVALATAYSILSAMRNCTSDADLAGCYQRILIITPQNQALYDKWIQETQEFVKKCVIKNKAEAAQWFTPVGVKRIDELSRELRTPGIRPRILITTMGLFSGGKLEDYKLKRRFLLGCCFRYWGVRFRIDLRVNVLKGALEEENWAGNPDQLTELNDYERERLLFTEDEVLGALAELDRSPNGRKDATGEVEELLNMCKEIAEPYTRERAEQYIKIQKKLNNLYKLLSGLLIKQAFPLVIVDEAHHWKNGPSHGANGYYEFKNYIADKARRVLLLTATPFQLCPDELLEILKVSDDIKPCPTISEAKQRTERLRSFREDVVRKALNNSARTSQHFSKEWARLGIQTTGKEIQDIWASVNFRSATSELDKIAINMIKIDTGKMFNIVEKAVSACHPNVKSFLHKALDLHTYNKHLSNVLGAFVVRHRRRTDHRLFRVGAECELNQSEMQCRFDIHLLHSAPGLDVRGAGELPHYLLMRCVTEAKKSKGRRGRSSLGSDLTGCYSTLLVSAEGKTIKKWLENSQQGKGYLELLTAMVSPQEDVQHPKVIKIVDRVLENWRRGEKTLIFCVRVNTAQQLQKIIDLRLREEMKDRERECLGGKASLKTLQGRLTSREQDLVAIGLDRVLLSFLWFNGAKNGKLPVIQAKDMILDGDEIRELAHLFLQFNIPISTDKIDRVFLTRATEYILAKRLLLLKKTPLSWTNLLGVMSHVNMTWISYAYGHNVRQETDSGGADSHNFDERGVHTVYTKGPEPNDTDIDKLAAEFISRREKARKSRQVSVFDVYAQGPNLLLGIDPIAGYSEIQNIVLIKKIHQYLWELSTSKNEEFDWLSRRRVCQAVRKAVFRQSVMLRLLPNKIDLEESSWGKMLVEAFYKSLPGQEESMAHRISVFLEDLASASGSLSAEDPNDKGLRYALYSSTRLQDQQFVALVSGTKGSKDNETRGRIFSGFNTPLLPEILICTQVGQEGIDLHRHCRHVVHYDLAWNPAVLEQRTGRADRIGSKTFRERDAANKDKLFLEIDIPFLAGTYDERMYEELRLRSQMFEVLTGGEFTADHVDEEDGSDPANTEIMQHLHVPLPQEMIDSLRVRLHVWSESAMIGIG